MLKPIVLSTVVLMSGTAFAATKNVPSQEYVHAVNTATIEYADADKVSVAAGKTQTMAGAYTVSGTLNVPTPTLPTVEE